MLGEAALIKAVGLILIQQFALLPKILGVGEIVLGHLLVLLARKLVAAILHFILIQQHAMQHLIAGCRVLQLLAGVKQKAAGTSMEIKAGV